MHAPGGEGEPLEAVLEAAGSSTIRADRMIDAKVEIELIAPL